MKVYFFKITYQDTITMSRCGEIPFEVEDPNSNNNLKAPCQTDHSDLLSLLR